ncbi:hypothetical protein [Nocardia colli]|uniref:hypothetical protein n=1 Tax=Nocardia colli TaxID=2545717 RepID=UPI0035D9D44E
MNALSDDASTCTEIDFARTTNFAHASMPWMRELGGELNKSVTAVFEREVMLSPVIATLFRLTAMCLASESDVRRGPRDIRAACQKIVTAVTILELR